MKCSKQYYDAMWVLENREKYDDRDVIRAQTYVDTYMEGFRDDQLNSLPLT